MLRHLNIENLRMSILFAIFAISKETNRVQTTKHSKTMKQKTNITVKGYKSDLGNTYFPVWLVMAQTRDGERLVESVELNEEDAELQALNIRTMESSTITNTWVTKRLVFKRKK